MCEFRTEVSLQAPHAAYVSQKQKGQHAGPHQHLTGLVQETQQYQEMFEESRTAQSAAGAEINRLRQREAEFIREVRRDKNDRAKFQAPSRNRTELESYKFRTSGGLQTVRELRSEIMQLQASAVPPNFTRDSTTLTNRALSKKIGYHLGSELIPPLAHAFYRSDHFDIQSTAHCVNASGSRNNA